MTAWLLDAGDIVPFAMRGELMDVYKKLTKKFKTVIHVPGNHEYYCHKKKWSMTDCVKSRECTELQFSISETSELSAQLCGVRFQKGVQSQ